MLRPRPTTPRRCSAAVTRMPLGVFKRSNLAQGPRHGRVLLRYRMPASMRPPSAHASDASDRRILFGVLVQFSCDGIGDVDSKAICNSSRIDQHIGNLVGGGLSPILIILDCNRLLFGGPLEDLDKF